MAGDFDLAVQRLGRQPDYGALAQGLYDVPVAGAGEGGDQTVTGPAGPANPTYTGNGKAPYFDASQVPSSVAVDEPSPADASGGMGMTLKGVGKPAEPGPEYFQAKYEAELARLKTMQEDLAKREQGAATAATEQAQSLKDAKARNDAIQAELKGLKQPEPEKFEEPPTPPEQRIRPFMEVEPGQSPLESLQRISGMLGLLGMMWAGRGAPVAALSALSGAMKGWKAGQEAKAELDWRRYLGMVDKIRAHNDLIKERNSALIKQWTGNMDRLKLETELLANDMGFSKDMIALAYKDPEQFAKQVEIQGRVVNQLGHDTATAMAAHMRAIQAAQARNSKFNATVLKMQEGIVSSETFLKQMVGLVPKMEAAGLTLPANSNPIQRAQVMARWEALTGTGLAGSLASVAIPVSDEARAVFGEWQKLQAAAIGFARGILNDVNARVAAAYTGELVPFMRPQTSAALLGGVEIMRQQLQAMKEQVPAAANTKINYETILPPYSPDIMVQPGEAQ